jgi:4,5-dihydroxyphthalate decarboxylase
MRTLKVGSGRYDRIMPLAEGTVTIPGYELAVDYMPVTKIPPAAWGTQELDLAEVAMGQLLEKIEAGDDRYLGLPVFPSVAFRHDSVYVPSDSPVKALADLQGARLGTTQYFGTTTIWIRALLERQYGLDLSACDWTIGPLSKPAGQIRRHHPDGAKVSYLEVGDCLEAKVDRGELDAVLSYVPPRQVKEARMRQLIADLPAAEREWMAQFGSAPLLHVMMLRRSLAEADPELAPALVRAFSQARDLAVERLDETACLTASIPFLPRVLAEARALLGPSIWPCGLAETIRGIEAFHDFAHTQGLTARRIGLQESFVLAGDAA